MKIRFQPSKFSFVTCSPQPSTRPVGQRRSLGVCGRQADLLQPALPRGGMPDCSYMQLSQRTTLSFTAGFPTNRQWQWTWPVEMEERPVLKALCRLVNRPRAGRTMVLPARLLMDVDFKPRICTFLAKIALNISQEVNFLITCHSATGVLLNHLLPNCPLLERIQGLVGSRTCF
jgi:hypothetical protein